jgi:hypothetical protein
MENRSTHLSTWVNADLKERFAAAAARQGLSESALLKRLVEQMLAGAGEELTAERPTAVARDARVTVRLVPDNNLLLRERAVSTGPAGRFGRNRPGAEPQALPKRSSRATGTYIRSRAIDQVEPGRGTMATCENLSRRRWRR